MEKVLNIKSITRFPKEIACFIAWTLCHFLAFALFPVILAIILEARDVVFEGESLFPILSLYLFAVMIASVGYALLKIDCAKACLQVTAVISIMILLGVLL